MVLYASALKVNMRGSAIILAMGISALVVILAVAMMMSLRMDMRRVERLEHMTERHSLVMASEAMGMRMITSIFHGETQDRTFNWEEEGIKVMGELLDLPNATLSFDKEIPVEGEMKLLHTQLKYKKIIDVYSLFRLHDDRWDLLYRSYGARE